MIEKLQEWVKRGTNLLVLAVGLIGTYFAVAAVRNRVKKHERLNMQAEELEKARENISGNMVLAQKKRYQAAQVMETAKAKQVKAIEKLSKIEGDKAKSRKVTLEGLI